MKICHACARNHHGWNRLMTFKTPAALRKAFSWQRDLLQPYIRASLDFWDGSGCRGHRRASLLSVFAPGGRSYDCNTCRTKAPIFPGMRKTARKYAGNCKMAHWFWQVFSTRKQHGDHMGSGFRQFCGRRSVPHLLFARLNLRFTSIRSRLSRQAWALSLFSSFLKRLSAGLVSCIPYFLL